MVLIISIKSYYSTSVNMLRYNPDLLLGVLSVNNWSVCLFANSPEDTINIW